MNDEELQLDSSDELEYKTKCINKPNSVLIISPEEEYCLTGFQTFPSKKPWYVTLWSLIPCFMIVISIAQVVMWLCADIKMSRLLRWDPLKRMQVWRLASYMLLHRDATHLIINVILQVLIAAPLEREQGCLRPTIIYIMGGVAGALGASIIKPQPMIGASAGVYAILISHLAHLILNLKLKYPKYRLFSVSLLIVSDIFCTLYAHLPISVSAHVAGGAAGAFVGLAIYKGNSKYYIRYIVIFFIIVMLLSATFILYFRTK